MCDRCTLSPGHQDEHKTKEMVVAVGTYQSLLDKSFKDNPFPNVQYLKQEIATDARAGGMTKTKVIGITKDDGKIVIGQ